MRPPPEEVPRVCGDCEEVAQKAGGSLEEFNNVRRNEVKCQEKRPRSLHPGNRQSEESPRSKRALVRFTWIGSPP